MHVWCLGYKWVWSSAMLTVIRCKKIRSHEVIYLGSPLSLCCVQQRAGELPWNKATYCKHIIILHIIFQVATALLVAGSTLTFHFTHNIFLHVKHSSFHTHVHCTHGIVLFADQTNQLF